MTTLSASPAHSSFYCKVVQVLCIFWFAITKLPTLQLSQQTLRLLHTWILISQMKLCCDTACEWSTWDLFWWSVWALWEEGGATMVLWGSFLWVLCTLLGSSGLSPQEWTCRRASHRQSLPLPSHDEPSREWRIHTFTEQLNKHVTDIHKPAWLPWNSCISSSWDGQDRWRCRGSLLCPVW